MAAKRQSTRPKRQKQIACGTPSRKGLDPEVIGFLKKIDTAFRDMRMNLGNLPGEDDPEGQAVKQYLVYLSMLVDVALAGLAMNAVHGNDLMIIMLQRTLIEYATKGLYYQAHPKFAVFMLFVNYAESAVQRAKDRGEGPGYISEREQYATTMRERYAAYANTAGVNMRHMMESMGRTEEWASLYGLPSLLLHGEPEGMGMIYDVTEAGVRPRIDLNDSYINALLVDAGANVLSFCRAFVAEFHPANDSIKGRFEALEKRAHALILKHDYGRPTAPLDELRKQHSA